jgi:Flp pilus assembly protein TadG
MALQHSSRMFLRMNKCENLLRRFSSNRRGSIVVTAALMLPAIMFGTGAAVDVSRWYNLQAAAQNAADAAALATVREVALAGMTDQKLTESAKVFARAALGDAGSSAIISASVAPLDGSLTVNVKVKGQPSFGRILGITEMNTDVSATARLVGKMKICLLALETGKSKTMEASKDARITATDCSFFINSTDAKAISVKDSARFSAQLICSAGGFDGSSINFAPQPKRDCPPIPDPLAKRPPPTAGNCDYTNHVVDKGTALVRPGVYCGGLRVSGSAVAKLDPGIYVMRDGGLLIENNSTLEGKDVGFYMQGSKSTINFQSGTTIDLSAPVSGEMAGLLFYEDRGVTKSDKHRIYSDNAHTLLGTIYLPMGQLYIEANKPISQKAAYTIIVAGQIEMTAGPELFLNANYGASTVPVPAGVGALLGTVQLVR